MTCVKSIGPDSFAFLTNKNVGLIKLNNNRMVEVGLSRKKHSKTNSISSSTAVLYDDVANQTGGGENQMLPPFHPLLLLEFFDFFLNKGKDIVVSRKLRHHVRAF